MDALERLRDETKRRDPRGLLDTSDLRFAREGDEDVLVGSVDDATAKALVEAIARETFGDKAIRTRITVRDDVAAEAGAKETEFGTAEAARAATTSIPRPR